MDLSIGQKKKFSGMASSSFDNKSNTLVDLDSLILDFAFELGTFGDTSSCSSALNSDRRHDAFGNIGCQHISMNRAFDLPIYCLSR